jgi:hypothetical protein
VHEMTGDDLVHTDYTIPNMLEGVVVLTITSPPPAPAWEGSERVMTAGLSSALV